MSRTRRRRPKLPPFTCQPLCFWLFLLLLVLTSAFRLPSAPLSSSSSPRTPPHPSTSSPYPPTAARRGLPLLQGWRPILNPTTSTWPLRPQSLEQGVVDGGWVRANRSGRKVLLRRMVMGDLGAVLDMAQSEFGTSGEGLLAQLENWYLRRNVFFSFLCRLNYWGDEEDHRVFVVDDGGVVGVVEVSKQAQTGLPGPLLPVPRVFKLLLDALGFKIKPYIGNLLIDRSCRRQGYAQMLVQHCESYAASIGYDEVYLHADADYRPACALYARLGYETLRDDPPWVERLGRMRMRYMRKKLTSLSAA